MGSGRYEALAGGRGAAYAGQGAARVARDTANTAQAARVIDALRQKQESEGAAA